MVHSEFNQLIYFVITTEANIKNAHNIANTLLIQKLIPCVTFKNIESKFWWKGEIKQSKEVQLIFKCNEQNIKKVCKKISDSHSYEVPEIICFPVSANRDYYHWVNSF